MTLDAIRVAINDPFNTLSHSSNRQYPSMSPRHSLPRRSESSSPKIAFTTAIYSTKDASVNLKRNNNSKRSMVSNGASFRVSGGNDATGEVIDDRQRDGVRKETNKKKIDWEIPRKTLHSSIGN